MQAVILSAELILILLVGYCAQKFKLVQPGFGKTISAFVMKVALPCMIVNSMNVPHAMEKLKANIWILAVSAGVLVFSFFNFRPKGKAKCFAGDVGSIGIAFIMLFALGRLIVQTGDLTYLVFLLIYGVDGCCTIIHRLMLHEHIGEAHRKHAYQLMCNELKIGHVKISLLYMFLQLAVSLGFIYLCPNTVLAHWVYLLAAGAVLAVAYVVFMRKYYHLHEEYLASLKK